MVGKAFGLLAALSIFTTTVKGQDTTDHFPWKESIDTAYTATSIVSTRAVRLPDMVTTSRIDREAIVASGQSAALSLLPAYVPGLFVTERGAAGFGVYSGSAGAITLRGVGASPTTQVLITIDGIPQYMGINGHHLADAIRSDQVGRISVERGPSSVVYGSNAMGGVINIVTLEPSEDGVHGNANVQYGSFNTYKYSIGAGARSERLSAQVTAGSDHTNGHRPFSSFDLRNAGLKVGYDLGRDWKVKANLSMVDFTSADPGTIQAPATTDTLTADVTRIMSSLSLSDRYTSAQLFYNHGVHDLYYGWHSRDEVMGARLTHVTGRRFSGRGPYLTGGAEYTRYGGKATDRSKPAFDLDKYIDEAAGFVQGKQLLFHDRLVVLGGLRLQYNSHFGWEMVPEGTLSYKIGPSSYRPHEFQLKVAKGFRNPSIRELYVFAPNENLAPERMVNYELRYLYSTLDYKVTAEASFYISDGSNIIQTVFAGGIPKESYNSGEFLNTGFEMGLRYNFSEGRSISANYSYVDMDKPLLGAPRQQANLTGDYAIGRFGLRAGVQYVEGMYTRTGAAPEKEDFLLLGARVSFRAHDMISLFLRSDNMLDQNYQMNYGYPMPGISVTGGISIIL